MQPRIGHQTFTHLALLLGGGGGGVVGVVDVVVAARRTVLFAHTRPTRPRLGPAFRIRFFTDPDLDPTQKPKADPDPDPGGKGKRLIFFEFFSRFGLF